MFEDLKDVVPSPQMRSDDQTAGHRPRVHEGSGRSCCIAMREGYVPVKGALFLEEETTMYRRSTPWLTMTRVPAATTDLIHGKPKERRRTLAPTGTQRTLGMHKTDHTEPTKRQPQDASGLWGVGSTRCRNKTASGLLVPHTAISLTREKRNLPSHLMP